MPTVPTYPGQRVGSTGVPRIQTRPEAFGGGQAIQVVDTGGASRLAEQIFDEAKQKADSTAKLEILNETVTAATDISGRISSLRMRDSLNAPDLLEEEWGKVRDTVLARAKNDTQRQQAELILADRKNALYDGAQRHMAQQMELHEDEVEKSLSQSLLSSLVEFSGSAEEREKTVMAIADLVERSGKRRGLALGVVETEKKRALSTAHSLVIDTLIAKEFDAEAEAYFKEVVESGGFFGTDEVKARQQVDVATTHALATNAVMKVWSEIGPSSLNDPVNAFDMAEAIRTALKDKPKAITAALSELNSKMSAWDAQTRQRTAVLKNELTDLILNRNATEDQVRRHPSYSLLSSEDQTPIINFARADSRRAEVERGKAEDETNLARYFDYLDTAKLADMSSEEVKALIPEIGVVLAERVASRWRGIQDAIAAGTSDRITVDRQIFDSAAHAAGYAVFGERRTTSQKAELALALNAVETAVNERLSEARAKNPRAQLSREEVTQITNRVLYAEGTLLGGGRMFGSKKDVKLAGVDPAVRAATAFIPGPEIDDGTLLNLLNMLQSRDSSVRIPRDVEPRIAFNKLPEAIQMRIQRAAAVRDLADAYTLIGEILSGAKK